MDTPTTETDKRDAAIQRLRDFLEAECAMRRESAVPTSRYVRRAEWALRDLETIIVGDSASRRESLIAEFAAVIESGGSDEAKSALPFLCAALSWAINEEHH